MRMLPNGHNGQKKLRKKRKLSDRSWYQFFSIYFPHVPHDRLLQVRLAYEDDRKEKKVRDEMEKQRREAVAARAALEAVQDAPANAKEGSPDDRVPMTN